ncbi:tyrosine-type recombinase/integrase [Mesonia maritima]|uniref:tyrosine-type recombinase/integrase n=1 Tax=Mesonia maritima TaxID=1793873 RepID=UPI00364344D9
MYNFTFNINKNSKKKGAKIPLKIRYYESRDKRIQIDTGIKIALRHWSDSKKALKNTSEIKDSYIEFERQNRLAQKIVNYYKENKKPLTCTKFKYHFTSEDLTEFDHEQLTFFEELDYFIENKKNSVVPDVIKDYKTLKKHLLCYESFDNTILDFDRINYAFYQKWCDFLAYHYEKKNGELGLKNNSIGKSVKNLKAFLNHSIRTNRIKKIDLSGFVAIQEEVDHIYLNEKEIQIISDLRICNDKELEIVRDFFIIGCYTGLRFSDISRIKPEYITNGLLSLRQKKTSGKVVIPIRRPALKALARYNLCSSSE